MKKTLRISFNGKTYEVVAEILDEHGAASPAAESATAAATAATAVTAPSPRPAAAPVAGSGDVPSPLAGKIVSIEVKVCDRVEAGHQLLVLEAMKMNTTVNAPFAGEIAAIHAQPGESVAEGQPLLTLR